MLYNNAGFGGAMGPLHETPTDEYDMTMDVLLKSVFLGIKHASPIMIGQRSGSIISTAVDLRDRRRHRSPHLHGGQGRRRHAHPQRGARAGRARHPGQLHLPGLIATPLAAGAPLGRDAERTAHRLDKLRGYNEGAQPLQRSGEPKDIANVALFLASDASSWMTGTAQVMDGGLHAGQARGAKLGSFITDHRPIRLYKPPTD